MKLFEDIPKGLAPSAVALGFFDGLHLAHRAVIGAAVAQKAAGLLPTVFTFDSERDRPVNKQGEPALLSRRRKLQLLAEMGVEQVIMPPFRQVCDLSAQAFLSDCLGSACHAAFLSCGYDYRFGRQAAGDVTLLRRFCSEAGITLSVLPRMDSDGVTVSTTVIRQLLQNGELTAANRMLGYPFTVEGPVVHGHGLGHALGFPTANQQLEPGVVVPRHGVYAARVTVDGKSYRGVTNVGVKPTVAQGLLPLAETHLIGFAGDLYGREIRVELLRFLRPETTFSSLEALQAAIAADREACLKEKIE